MPVTPEVQRRAHSGPYTEANHHKSNMSVNEDPMIMDAFSSSITWPWLDPLNWNDMQIDGSEHNLLDWVSPTTGEADDSVRGGPLSPNRPQHHSHGLGSDIFDISSSRSSSSSSNRSSSSNSSNSSIIANNIGPQAAESSNQPGDGKETSPRPLLNDTAFRP
ncbi:MAG: hypothetical protein Q9177_004517, partial [Variospora cf. flavescens]